MMGVYDDIKKGLEEAISYEQGNLKAKTTTMTIVPVCVFKPDEIKQIRKNSGLTQNLFAKYMGISVKTVEA